MTLKISFARAVGAALLASVPFFVGCAPEQKTEPIQHTPTTIATATAPAPKVAIDETTKLKLIASFSRDHVAAAIVADVIGPTNCVKTAEVFAKQVVNTSQRIKFDCIPQDEGLPVVTGTCSIGDGKVVCTPTLAP